MEQNQDRRNIDPRAVRTLADMKQREGKTSKTPEWRSATFRVQGLCFFFSIFLSSISARFLVTFLSKRSIFLPSRWVHPGGLFFFLSLIFWFWSFFFRFPFLRRFLYLVWILFGRGSWCFGLCFSDVRFISNQVRECVCFWSTQCELCQFCLIRLELNSCCSAQCVLCRRQSAHQVLVVVVPSLVVSSY